MDGSRFLLGIIFGLGVVVFSLTMGILIPTFNVQFYSEEYDKYDIPAHIAVEKEDLLFVTQHMLNYMRDTEDTLNVSTTVDNEYREFFNEKEIHHMVDVKDLISLTFQIRIVALVAMGCVLVLSIFFGRELLPGIAKTSIVVSVLVLVLGAVLVGIIALNFESAFTIFHEIFFTNDLWQLDPSTDLLINIVPLSFFMDISMYVAAVFFVTLVVCNISIYGICLIAPRDE